MDALDNLSQFSRAFYEQTRGKMAVSMFLSSMALMCLAYVSIYGGMSDSANNVKNVYVGYHDDSMEKSQQALAAGFGFGAFIFFIAFAVFIAAAVYISPTLCGSPNENLMISHPANVEQGDMLQNCASDDPSNPVHKL